jgi:WD40 repeat protein
MTFPDDPDFDDPVPDIRLRPRRALPIGWIALGLAIVGICLIAGVAIHILFTQPPRPPAPPLRPPQPAAPVEPLPAFDPRVAPGAKIAWTAIADPRPGPAAKVPAGENQLFQLPKFELQPIKKTQPDSLVALAVEERTPRTFAVIDLTTGMTRSRVAQDQIVCFDAAGEFLVREGQHDYEVCSMANDQVAARVPQNPEPAGMFGGVTGELAGADKLLLRSRLNHELVHRHAVWDWRKNRLLVDRRFPSRRIDFSCSALSPGGRYLVTISAVGDDEAGGPDEMVVLDVENGTVAGQFEVPPPEKREAKADKKDAKEETKRRPHSWNAIAFSRDGRRLGAVRSDLMLHIWDWTTGALLRKTPLDAPNHFIGGPSRMPMAIVDENEPVFIAGALHSAATGSKVPLPELPPGLPILSYPASGRIVTILKEPKMPIFGDRTPPRWFVRTIAFDPIELGRKDADVAAVDSRLVPVAPLPAQAAAPPRAPSPERHWPQWPMKTPRLKPAHALAVAAAANRAVEVFARELRNGPTGNVWPIEFVPLDLDRGVAGEPFVLDSPAPAEVHLPHRIDLSPDGKSLYMISLEDGRAIEVRDLKGTKLASWIATPTGKLEQIAVLPGGEILSRSQNGIALWRHANGKTRGLYRQLDAVAPFALDESGTHLAVGAADGWRIVDPRTGQTIVKLKGVKSRDPKLGGRAANNKKIDEAPLPTYPFDLVAFAPGGRHVAWLSTDRTVERQNCTLVVWGLSGDPVLRETIGRETLRPLDWLDEDAVWLGDVVFSVTLKTPIRWMPARSPLRPLAIPLDGRLALVDRTSGNVRRFQWPDAEAKKTLAQLDKEPGVVAIRPGDTVAFVCEFKGLPPLERHPPSLLKSVMEFRFRDLGYVPQVGPLDKGAGKSLRLEIAKDEPGKDYLRATFEWRENDRVLATDTYRPPRRTQQIENQLDGIYDWIVQHGPRWSAVRSGDGPDPAPWLPIPLVGEDGKNVDD